MPRRPGRGCFARLLIVLIILTVGAVLLVPYISLDRFRPQIEATLSSHLGRKVTVGSVHLSLSRGPALIIEDLKAAEDPAFGSGNMIEAGRVNVGLAVGPLVTSRRIVPTVLQLDEPRVTFNRNSRGAWSWSTLGNGSGYADLNRTSKSLGEGVNGSAANFLGPVAVLFGSLLKSGISNLRSSLVRGIPSHLLATLLTSGDVPSFKSIQLQRATVTFVEADREAPRQTVFDNIDFSAALSAEPAQPEPSTRAVGRIHASSEHTDTTEMLATDIPFDVTVGIADVGGFTVNGTVGPGDIRTSAVSAQNFKSSITVNANIARFDEIQASMYEGQLSGGLQLDLAASRPRFAVEGKLSNVNLDQSIGNLFSIPGAVTGHINGDFKVIGLMAELPRSFPTLSGDGQLSSDDLFIPGVNLSEHVARRLGISQIGNMAPGTNVGHIDQQFRISGGSISIQNLHLRQLDGLGDATADRGTINVTFSAGRPSIQVDFPTTVTLSPDAEVQAMRAIPLLGVAAALLQRSNQLSLPIHITGDWSSPQVLVDLPRMLQSLGQP